MKCEVHKKLNRKKTKGGYGLTCLAQIVLLRDIEINKRSGTEERSEDMIGEGGNRQVQDAYRSVVIDNSCYELSSLATFGMSS